MSKNRKKYENKRYIVDEEYLNTFLSNYHAYCNKRNEMGVGFIYSERWEFIRKNLKLALKRKMYGKIEEYNEPQKNITEG